MNLELIQNIKLHVWPLNRHNSSLRYLLSIDDEATEAFGLFDLVDALLLLFVVREGSGRSDAEEHISLSIVLNVNLQLERSSFPASQVPFFFNVLPEFVDFVGRFLESGDLSLKVILDILEHLFKEL